MKKLLLLLTLVPMFFSCSNNSAKHQSSDAAIDTVGNAAARLEMEKEYKSRTDSSLNKLSLMVKYGIQGDGFSEALSEIDNLKSYLLLISDDSLYVSSVRKKASSYLVILYPKIRKAYVAKAKETMWEKNIDVLYSGTTITMIGGAFANHATIKEVQEGIHDILYRLRFKRINYKWIKHDDDYTYYTIDSPKDSDFM